VKQGGLQKQKQGGTGAGGRCSGGGGGEQGEGGGIGGGGAEIPGGEVLASARQSVRRGGLQRLKQGGGFGHVCC
jgi:hypothetical protein